MCIATQDYYEVKAALLKQLKDMPPGKYQADGGFHMVEWSKQPGYYLAIYNQGHIEALHFRYTIKEVEGEKSYA